MCACTTPDGIALAPSARVESTQPNMPARKYSFSLERIAALQGPVRKGVRLPTTPPGAGLPPKVVRYLRDFSRHKQSRDQDATWHLPGYQILSRRDLLRR